jgi:very-short-patch-repair endonuclease
MEGVSAAKRNGELDLGQPGGSRAEIARRIRARKAEKNGRFESELAFQIRAHRLPEPCEQYFFAETLGRKFRSDFAWPAYRLLVEVHGGLWQRGGGGHSHPMHIVKDIERQQIATLLGWFVLPVTTDHVKNGAAIEMLERVLNARGWQR